MTDPNGERYWFPARRYGWGWGPPITWEGWLVTGLYLAGMLGGTLWLLPESPLQLHCRWFLPPGGNAFLGWSGLLTTLYLGICWLKGEPPAWRWGRRD